MKEKHIEEAFGFDDIYIIMEPASKIDEGLRLVTPKRRRVATSLKIELVVMQYIMRI